MTIEDLENLGVIKHQSKLYPNRFFVPYAGEVNLYPPYKIDDVFNEIYKWGHELGAKEGEKRKIAEIKQVLNIDEP